jgi:hypothetical protein
MKKLSLLFIIILLVVGYASESKESITVNDPIEQTAYKIILCESGGQHEGVWGDCDKSGIKNGKHCKAYGWAQFHKGTFNYMKKIFDMPNAKRESKVDQWKILNEALKRNLGGNWTCYKEG